MEIVEGDEPRSHDRAIRLRQRSPDHPWLLVEGPFPGQRRGGNGADRLDARQRGQSLAQLSLAWVLRNQVITSALIGASKVSQIEENVGALERPDFSEEELTAIDRILMAPVECG